MGVHKDEAYPKIKALLDIPEDEPIFILRAQDKLSIPAIARYQVMALQVDDGPNDDWHTNIRKVMGEFTDWQGANTAKVPD